MHNYSEKIVNMSVRCVQYVRNGKEEDVQNVNQGMCKSLQFRVRAWQHLWHPGEEQYESDFTANQTPMKLDRPSTPHSSPKHPASDCLDIPFLKSSVSQRARPLWLLNRPARFAPFALQALQTFMSQCCVTAVCSVPASAAPLHPSLLRNEERARLGGRSVPLPVSPFAPAPPAWRCGRRTAKLSLFFSGTNGRTKCSRTFVTERFVSRHCPREVRVSREKMSEE